MKVWAIHGHFTARLFRGQWRQTSTPSAIHLLYYHPSGGVTSRETMFPQPSHQAYPPVSRKIAFCLDRLAASRNRDLAPDSMEHIACREEKRQSHVTIIAPFPRISLIDLSQPIISLYAQMRITTRNQHDSSSPCKCTVAM